MISSYVVRALCALILGILLVMNPEQMTSILVQIIGSLFLVSGMVSLISYFFAYKSKSAVDTSFPIVGIGSFLFGVFLVAFPLYFISYLMITLGLMLILAGVVQIWNIIKYRHIIALRWFMFPVPLLIVLCGIWVIFYPQETASLPFVILGISSIIYAVSEFITAIKLYRLHR